MAKLYPPPRHDTIVEPFAGAAGYSTRYPDRKVILCDADPRIYETWRYLIEEATPEAIRALPILREGERVDETLGKDWPLGARYLVGFWLTQSQTYPSNNQQSRGVLGRGSGWTATIRERTATQLRFIKHWRIIHCSYVDLDEKHPELSVAPATWFVDPPYEVAGMRYRKSAKEIQFPHLASWSRARRGQVIVCEKMGAQWLPFQHLVTEKNASNRDNHEAVWLSDAADYEILRPKQRPLFPLDLPQVIE